MAIIAILIGIGVPGFQSVFKDSQQTTQYNSLRKSMEFARSEAIKRSHHVSVCARATGTTCGTNWSQGWLIFADPDTGTPGTPDGDDAVLRRVDLPGNTIEIAAKAIVRPAAMQSQGSIRFSPRGRANWTVGTLLLCDQRGEESAKALIINGAGSTRAAYSSATSGDIVIDAVGNNVDCA